MSALICLGAVDGRAGDAVGGAGGNVGDVMGGVDRGSGDDMRGVGGEMRGDMGGVMHVPGGGVDEFVAEGGFCVRLGQGRAAKRRGRVLRRWRFVAWSSDVPSNYSGMRRMFLRLHT